MSTAAVDTTTVATTDVTSLVEDLANLSVNNSDVFSILENLATQFYKNLLENNNDAIHSTIFEILRILTTDSTFSKYGFTSEHIGMTCTDNTKIALLNAALDKIVQIMSDKYEVQLNESDGKTQRLVSSHLAKMLSKVCDDNYHNIVRPCSEYNEKTKCCKNGNPLINGPNGTCNHHLYECDFHIESLALHLILAMIICGFREMNSTSDVHSIFKIMFTALVHDCAKIECTKTYDLNIKGAKKFTGFPAHGEFGAMKLQMHWNPKMETDNIITWNEYYETIDTVRRHMCGYHGSYKDGNRYKRRLLALLETENVKKLLTALRIGDHIGALHKDSDPTEPNEDSESNDPIEYLTNNQNEFMENMRKYDGDDRQMSVKFDEFCNLNKIIPGKVVVFMIGTSGAGKGHAASILIDELNNKGIKFGHVDRDSVVAFVLTGTYHRFLGNKYKELYKIYDLMKDLNSAISTANKANKNNKKTEFSDQQMKQFDDIASSIILAIDNWNAPFSLMESVNDFRIKNIVKGQFDSYRNIVEEVGQEFSNRIMEYLNNPMYKGVVIDTMMNLFPQAAKACYPKQLSQYFKIHWHVQNYCTRTDGSNVGEPNNIEKQLEVSGPFGPNQILHPGGSSNKADLKMFSSASTDNQSKGNVPSALGDDSFRPYDVISSMRTHVAGSIGYTEAIYRISRLVC